MRASYLRSPVIAYAMTRLPSGNPYRAESVIFVEDEIPSKFGQIFHASYPDFPLPKDMQEKYDKVLQVQLDFLKK